MATTENWRNKLAFTHDGLTTPTLIPGAAARLTSSPGDSYVRRGPSEGVVATGPLHIARGFTLELQHGTAAFWSAFLAGAIADAGSEVVDGATTTWSLGRSNAAPRRHAVLASHVSGTVERLKDAVLNTWQINVERRSAVRHLTDWRFLSTESATYEAVDETKRGYEVAGSRQVQATFGEDGAPVFACAINLTRDLRPAGFRHTGTPTTFDGSTAVEITGRILCQLTPTQSAALLAGKLTLPLALAISHGHTLTFSADVVCRSEGRRHLGDGMWEDDVIFAAVGPATLTLVQP